jgi:type II secretory pathway pseudopilin PulG
MKDKRFNPLEKAPSACPVRCLLSNRVKAELEKRGKSFGKGSPHKKPKILRGLKSLSNFLMGFTLIEGIVTIIILGFVVTTIVAVLNVGNQAWHTEMVFSELQQQVRLAIDGMAREIRQSSNITTPTEGGSGSLIDFYIPGSSNPISYYLNNTQIIREHPPGTTKILANSIEYLNFSRGQDTVVIQVNATKKAGARTLSFSLIEKVSLRND